MADNVAITAGVGTDVAADDVGSVFYQKIKLDLGTDGVTAPALAGAGVVATGVQRITLASDDPAVALLTTIDSDTSKITACNTGAVVLSSGTVTTVSTVTNLAQMGGAALNMGEGVISTGTQRVTLATDDDGVAHLSTIAGDTTSVDGKITACDTGAVVVASGAITETNSGSIKTAVELLDNAVDGNYLNTNLNIAGTDVSANAGVLTAQTQRVTIATDDEVNNLLGTIDTDTGVIAGDTTSIDGKITACNTGAVVLAAGSAAIGKLAANSGVDIGDVDILSIAAGDNNIGNVDIVTIPAPLNVVGGGTEAAALRVTLANDSTGVVTVDGTITEANSGTIAGDTTSIDGKITACNTGAVVVASGAITEDNSAAILVDTGNIETAVQIIDDWDATHASAAPADGACIMGAAYSAGLPADVGADADAARICVDRHGRGLSGLMPQWFNAVYDSADATAEAEVVKAAVADRKIYIMSYVISSDVEGWIKLQDEDSNALTGKLWLKAGGGVSWTAPANAPLVLNTANKALEVIAEAAGNVSVTITGYIGV